jgi:hypothetical protein
MSFRRIFAQALVVMALTVAVLIASITAYANPKPKPELSSSTTSSPFALQTESVSSSFSLVAPSWCLNEDDYNSRSWSGSLTGTFTATEYFCTPGVDISGGYPDWDGGGVGLMATIAVVGTDTLDHLRLSNQGGMYNPPVTQDAVWTGSSRTGSGRKRDPYVVTNYYRACAFWNGANFGSMGPWTGTWTLTVSGSLTKSSLSLAAEMFSYAEGQCPQGQQVP